MINRIENFLILTDRFTYDHPHAGVHFEQLQHDPLVVVVVVVVLDYRLS